jgi:serine/threonine protein kinase
MSVTAIFQQLTANTVHIAGVTACSKRQDRIRASLALKIRVVSPQSYNHAQRMGLTSGTKLGPYEVQSPLGAGGMGEVYRGRDTRLDRTVAIKILPAHLSSNPEAKQRFEREARAISSLNDPNICTLYDVGRQDGIDYLVMEFLEGETLASRLVKGPLPPEQVLKHGIEICKGLQKAHKTGVIHRDLKPGNINGFIVTV